MEVQHEKNLVSRLFNWLCTRLRCKTQHEEVQCEACEEILYCKEVQCKEVLVQNEEKMMREGLVSWLVDAKCEELNGKEVQCEGV